jgi:tol-pal system protein YbgF
VNQFKRQSRLVVYFICAAVAAQFSYAPAYAAVPIEESVEDSRRDSEPVVQSQGQPQVELRASQRARSLDIPPTIEPSVNTDYRSEPAPVNAQQPPRVGGGSAGGQLSELFYQLQILQQEIQDLRGQVEEQTYLVNRLQRDQKEQYLDLDRRLVAVSENQPAPGPSSTTPPSTTSRPLQSGNLTEREAYTQAFEAMRAREFDNSMAGFQRLIETYPNGQFTPNAYYWIGELQLVAKDDAELARQSFTQVVTLYPDHQKAPDAMYKLGVVYHNLGDVTSALSFLQRVQNEHPSSPAAGLAAKYAAELE